MRRLKIDPEMSRRLGECGLSRDAVPRFRTEMREDLEGRYEIYRSSRHPEDERFFIYLLAVPDGVITHRFYFVIDDTTSPDHLFIQVFRHELHMA